MNTNQNSTPSANQTAASTLSVLDTAAANGSFGIFGRAVEKAGLKETLAGPGPFTVFAPTDAAFDSLPAGKLDELFKPENKEQLSAIINYHVVNGRRSAADVGKWDAARTVNGQPAPIKRDGETVSIDGARITVADLTSSNGVVHGIDKVNLPAAKKN